MPFDPALPNDKVTAIVFGQTQAANLAYKNCSDAANVPGLNTREARQIKDPLVALTAAEREKYHISGTRVSFVVKGDVSGTLTDDDAALPDQVEIAFATAELQL